MLVTQSLVTSCLDEPYDRILTMLGPYMYYVDVCVSYDWL